MILYSKVLHIRVLALQYLVDCLRHGLESLNVRSWFLTPRIPVPIHLVAKLNQH